MVLGLIESIFKLIYYSERNAKSKFTGNALFVFLLAVEVFRLTLSRILTLLTALGLDIVIKSVQKYMFQLVLFSFMFVLSLIVDIALQYTVSEYILSNALVSLVNGLVECLDIMLIFWIVLAFQRLLNYLKKEELTYKEQIVSRIYYSFSFCIILSILLEVS